MVAIIRRNEGIYFRIVDIMLSGTAKSDTF